MVLRNSNGRNRHEKSEGSVGEGGEGRCNYVMRGRSFMAIDPFEPLPARVFTYFSLFGVPLDIYRTMVNEAAVSLLCLCGECDRGYMRTGTKYRSLFGKLGGRSSTLRPSLPSPHAFYSKHNYKSSIVGGQLYFTFATYTALRRLVVSLQPALCSVYCPDL